MMNEMMNQVRPPRQESMTELDLYIQLIPAITGLAEKCRGMNSGEYEAWKKETLDSAPERGKGFLQKVMTVLDDVRTRPSWSCPK